MRLADVAMPVPIARAFTYAVPDAMAAAARPGARVVCPFGSRRMVGVVLACSDGEPPPNTRAIASVLDDEPAVPPDLLSFLRDVASYYFAPVGEVMRLALPPVEREAARELAAPSLFAPERAKGVGARRVQWAQATAHESAGPLRGQAAAVLAHLRAAGAEPIATLESRWSNARDAVRRLVELGLAEIVEHDAPEAPAFDAPVARDIPHQANDEQRAAIDAVIEALDQGPAQADAKPRTFLLHGVTGSGKTEVYLRVIAAARERKRGSILLVPEIALTPQLVARFRARFGDDVAVLHSALTPRERHAMWRRLRSGEVDVAIGARSALFAPIRDLSLVIVDEEHDASFKQEDGVRYHARDMAIWRAHRAGGVCVLGSATPSLESEHLVRTGRASKLRLPSRARAQPLPRVEIIDLRRVGAGPTGDRRLSLPLVRALEETLAAKEQSIVFLNRRGFAPSVRCTGCGEMLACSECSVALTFHKRTATVRCHYCDYSASLPKRCSACDEEALLLEGLGTEKLEEAIAQALPGARVARLDRDVAAGKRIETILAKVRAREIDVLVGTQMVTKGHDLPNVTLVGVINADAALSIPDFRAGERGFQLLVQVAGRAGRGDSPGRVLIQTWDPDHPSVALAAKHDVDRFIERELAGRRELTYPPLARAALVRVDSADEEAAARACAELAGAARATDAARREEVIVKGPAVAPIERIRGRWRYHLMLRSPDRSRLRAVLAAVERARQMLPREVRASIDVDPVQLL